MFHSRLPEEGIKPGGVSVFVHRLANALVQRDHDVTMFTHGGAPFDAAYGHRRLRPFRGADHRLSRQYVAPWLLNVRPFRSGYDVVHLHGDDWFYLRRQLPTVRTFYGSALYEALTATSTKRRVNQLVTFGLELTSRSLADAVYAIGTDSRAMYRADGILGTGVEVDPAGDAERHPTPVILFVGTWEGRKRGALLRDRFRDVIRPAVPDAELWMVADRAEEGDGVRWFHAPSDEELSALYRRAWAFCLPSRYEGLGMPYLEAMAHGVPVVASPNPGAQDVLGAGRWGRIVEDDQLGPALLELLTDPDLRRSLSDLGRERARDFAWDRVIADHEAAYALAIHRHSGRAVARSS
jgi:glycosyltransferase involved in cell wall biosynthesis